jgi:pyridoxine kinase
MEQQKKILAIHDLSCVGKCSLTVALPVLSAAGIETDVMPTAVLSTQTGGFTGYTFRDLTEDIPKIAAHWRSIGLRFDAIYTGYLGSYAQLAAVSRLIDEFRGERALVCVDPVMADGGRLYESFRPDFPCGMAKLCAKADLVVPNVTEAAFLLGEPYREGPYGKAYLAGLLHGLAARGPRKVVLTGVWTERAHIGCAVYDGETDKADLVLGDRVEGLYHGTGDVFASALLGALLNGFPLLRAARIGVDFTEGCIRRTHDAGTDPRLGVNFEAGLPRYIRSLGLETDDG